MFEMMAGGVWCMVFEDGEGKGGTERHREVVFVACMRMDVRGEVLNKEMGLVGVRGRYGCGVWESTEASEWMGRSSTMRMRKRKPDTTDAW